MSYMSLHKSNERLELAMTLLLIAGVVAAMSMMFVHPSVAILIFFMGLVATGVWTILELMLRRWERIEVRHAIAEHTCPQCGNAINSPPADSSMWQCDQCGSEFTSQGDVLLLNE